MTLPNEPQPAERDQTAESSGWTPVPGSAPMVPAAGSPHDSAPFGTPPPLPNAAWLGAQHGAEIPYALNWPNGTHSASVAWTAADRTLADQVSQYWVNFATSGNPNGKGLPQWPAFDPKNEKALGIADTISVVPVPNTAALDFLDQR